MSTRCTRLGTPLFPYSFAASLWFGPPQASWTSNASNQVNSIKIQFPVFHHLFLIHQLRTLAVTLPSISPRTQPSGTPTHEPLYGSPHTYINREPKNDTFIIFESASVSLIFSRLLLIFGFPLANPHHWHCDGSQALSSNIRRCACRSTREHRRPTLLSLYSGVQPQMVLRLG